MHACPGMHACMHAYIHTYLHNFICNVVILRLLSRVSYVLLLSSEIRCKACSFSSSSFHLFLTPQMCRTLLQFRKYGVMKALYNLVSVLLDTIFLKRLITLQLIVNTITDIGNMFTKH